MGSTKAQWRNNILEWYDSTTYETVRNAAPVQFADDFVGANGLAALPAASSEEAGVPWAVIDVGAATQAYVADAAGGVVALTLTSASEAQDAAICFNDQLCFNVANGGTIEFRIDMAVAPGTGVAAVAGLAGPHNLDKDTVANHAWFRWQASLVTLTESDDTTNNNDDTATGITAVAGTYDIYKIDFHDLTDVKFYINGVRVSQATTFDMSNLTAAESIMQPYFSLDKASGAALGTMKIDYVKFWGHR